MNEKIFILAGIIASILISCGGLGTKQAALIFLLSPFGIEAQKVIVLSLLNYTFSGIIIGCAGLILALTEARNNKEPSEFKTPILLPKNRFLVL